MSFMNNFSGDDDALHSSVKANKADQQYCDLLQDIENNGVRKSDRTGTGTKSVFGRQLRFDMKDGFPLLTSKKMFVKGILTELMWFLGKHMGMDQYKYLGRTNIRYLLDNECNIWVGDAYKRYCKECKLGNESLEHIDDWTLGNPRGVVRLWTKHEFIELIKGDDDFAKKWGDLGPIYGQQWMSWGEHKAYSPIEVLCEPVKTLDELQDTLLQEGMCVVEKPQKMVSQGVHGINQVANLIKELKANPDSRRLMVTAWNPSDLDESVLPPCHYGFQCYTTLLTDWERYAYMESTDPEAYKFMRGRMWTRPGMFREFMDLMGVPTRKLSLMWNQRSVDTCLGLPFNIASYAFLLHMLADQVGMIPGELIGNLGDTHIYDNHWAGVENQLSNKTFPLPTLKIKQSKMHYDISQYDVKDFEIIDYHCAPAVAYPLSN